MKSIWYLHGSFLYMRDGVEKDGLVYGVVEAENEEEIEARAREELTAHYGPIKWNDGPNYASVELIAEWLQGFNQDIRDQIALMMAVTRRVKLGTSTRHVTRAGRELSDALLKMAEAINELPEVEGIHHQSFG